MKTVFIFLVGWLIVYPSLLQGGVVKDFSAGDEDYAVGDNQRNPGKICPCALGDINGDGYDDLVLAAPRAVALGESDTGIVYVRFGLNFGKSAGYIHESWYDLSSTITQTLDPTVSAVNFPDGYRSYGGVQINGEVAGGRFGSSVAMGDFDADGIDDIAISMGEYLEPAGPGRVYVLKGRTDIAGTVDLATERGNYLSFYITGRHSGDRFGEYLSFVDLDNDGRDDLVMGTPRGASGGEVDIFYGRSFSCFFFQNADALPEPHTHIIAEEADDALGSAFAAGDLTGDGIADLCIGAPDNSSYASYAGRTYLFEGANRNFSEGLPLLSGTVDLSSTTRTLPIVSRISPERSGSALAIGDLNGDGLNDLAIAAPLWSDDAESLNRGRVYILYNDGARFRVTGGGSIELASADTRFASLRSEDRLGTQIGFFNLDKDACDDLVITAPPATPDGRPVAGEAWIIQGRSGTAAFNLMIYYVRWGDHGVRIEGEESGDYVGTAIAVGDFNGDGSGDVFFTGDAGMNSSGKSAWGIFGSPSYHKSAAEPGIWTLYR